jgi:hypothetical protein
MADNPYKQKAPLPGQSADLVPDESPITMADMIRQEGGSTPRAMKKRREDVARRAIASSSPPSTPSTIISAGGAGSPESIEAIRAGDTPESAPMSEGEIDNQTSLAEMLQRDREKFQGMYGNQRVEAVAGAGGRREDPSQPWPDEKKNWVHGTLDNLRKTTGGSWEINYEGEGGEIEFIDLNTGETTSEYWEGKQ